MNGIVTLSLFVLAFAPSAAASTDSDLESYPLEPPDVSSPEATLGTFMRESKAAIDAYAVGDSDALQARADRVFQTLETPTPENDAEFLEATESALYLFEILSRVQVPRPKDIPGPDLDPADMPRQWTIPHTELRMDRFDTEEGEPLGYRFSKETIERLPEFYERVQALPVRKRFASYEGVAERFRIRPGLQAPQFVHAAVRALPPVWFNTFAGEPLWKWVALVLTIGFAFLLFALLYRLASSLQRATEPGAGLRSWLPPLLAVAAIALFAFVRDVTLDWIRPTGVEREFVVGSLTVLVYLTTIWLVFQVAGRLADSVIHLREMGRHALDAQLVRLVSKLGAVLLAFYLLVGLADSLGVPVAPILAGLGVGGLAVALAVRPTLENVVGGFVLFVDAPVKVGEFCRFGDKVGTVEAIGLRSVRLRGVDRTVITVPNADFCQLELINFTRRDFILLKTTLGLRYETTPDQLRLVLARIRELLIAHPRVSPDPGRVRFVGYGSSSLDVEIFAYIRTTDFNEFLAIQEDINLRIKDLVESSGSGFAFPSRTLYVEQSDGLDEKLSEAAEAEVQRWRDQARLPFPDHDPETRLELAGTLDYPPEGSVTS